MLGWLAVVSVPLMVLAVILLVTVRFSNPVRLEVLIVPADTVLVTDRLLNSPIAVMLGWFAVVNVPLMVLAVMLLVTVRFSKPVRLEVLIVPADTVLVTDRLLNSPTAVMFGWFAVVSVPLIVFALILPVTVSELKLPREVILSSVPCASVPLKLPPSITPLTDRFVNWPIAVMFGWFAVVSVP